MKAKAFLELAHKLSKSSDCEASQRSCVSRSYYALFNCMAEFINSHVETLPKTAQAHDKVYKYLFECEIDRIEELASNLNDLRKERNESDYDLGSQKYIDPNTAIINYLKAEKSFEGFERFVSSSTNRKKLIHSIIEYKRKINL